MSVNLRLKISLPPRSLCLLELFSSFPKASQGSMVNSHENIRVDRKVEKHAVCAILGGWGDNEEIKTSRERERGERERRGERVDMKKREEHTDWFIHNKSSIYNGEEDGMKTFCVCSERYVLFGSIVTQVERTHCATLQMKRIFDSIKTWTERNRKKERKNLSKNWQRTNKILHFDILSV